MDGVPLFYPQHAITISKKNCKISVLFVSVPLFKKSHKSIFMSDNKMAVSLKQ